VANVHPQIPYGTSCTINLQSSLIKGSTSHLNRRGTNDTTFQAKCQTLLLPEKSARHRTGAQTAREPYVPSNCKLSLILNCDKEHTRFTLYLQGRKQRSHNAPDDYKEGKPFACPNPHQDQIAGYLQGGSYVLDPCVRHAKVNSIAGLSFPFWGLKVCRLAQTANVRRRLYRVHAWNSV
jgi:hypothetical protein